MKLKLFKTPRILRRLFPRRTWGFSLDIPQVYLTFDDGPHPDITPWILDFLAEKSIKATFFCVGENLVKFPEIAERIRKEGHVIGNHTYKHEKSPKVSYKRYKTSIDATRKITNNNLFRPPYGRLAWNRSVKISKEYKIIMWSWLSYDYDQTVPLKKILNKAEKQIQAGDIIVLHDNRKVNERLQNLLPELITIIQKKGFAFSTIPFS